MPPRSCSSSNNATLPASSRGSPNIIPTRWAASDLGDPDPHRASGDEEWFPPTRLSAGYGFRKETITGMRRNRRGAPTGSSRCGCWLRNTVGKCCCVMCCRVCAVARAAVGLWWSTWWKPRNSKSAPRTAGGCRSSGNSFSGKSLRQAADKISPEFGACLLGNRRDINGLSKGGLQLRLRAPSARTMRLAVPVPLSISQQHRRPVVPPSLVEKNW